MKDDTISRQAAIDAINHICPVDTEYDCIFLDRVDVRYVLSDLPSAQPERKVGRWIYGENDCQDGWFCSACGEFIPWDYNYYGSDCDFIRDFKTCPFCDTKMVSYTGADMRGEENG